MKDPRRAIPAIDRLLASDPFAEVLAANPRGLVVEALQDIQRRLRIELSAGISPPNGPDEFTWYADRARALLAVMRRPSLRRVINATGVVLHTNLGRAPLADAAVQAMLRVAHGYSNLEYDIERGTRGSRYDHCTGLLARLTGAEAALVVNNNAAALVLALNTLARGREVVISRGELVEIGGSFRIPEIMVRSGARMVEVGSTNRTHLGDYVAAMGDRTGAILKVHPSNFRVTGFTADVEVAALAEVSRARNVPLLHDLGSGLLIEAERLGLPYEPTPADTLRAGADLVTLSGDKLLGGPQAGILLGRAALVERMRRNPLCRALRVDKLTLAALEATLSLYLEPERARAEIPVLRMLATPADELRVRAGALAAALGEAGIEAEIVPGSSAVGGGAFPTAELPTHLLLLARDANAMTVERRLRASDPPVVARIIDDRLAIDLRTVPPEDEATLMAALRSAMAS
ncbi:MAG: L-seryl-tRNA(Sec) selenium transferase [Longimicrobiales bacterium]